MDDREVAIEHDHVVLVDERACQACLAVQSDVDGHPRLAQAGGDRLGQLLVVLDHKHPHRSLPSKVTTGCFNAVSPAPATQTVASVGVRNTAETAYCVEPTPQADAKETRCITS